MNRGVYQQMIPAYSEEKECQEFPIGVTPAITLMGALEFFFLQVYLCQLQINITVHLKSPGLKLTIFIYIKSNKVHWHENHSLYLNNVNVILCRNRSCNDSMVNMNSCPWCWVTCIKELHEEYSIKTNYLEHLNNWLQNWKKKGGGSIDS